MKLICMAFDGEYQTEHPTFRDRETAWQYANDIGSKWYFYPFYFLVSDTGKTIVDAPREIDMLIGKRVKTAVKLFAKQSRRAESEGLNVEAYLYALTTNF